MRGEEGTGGAGERMVTDDGGGGDGDSGEEDEGEGGEGSENYDEGIKRKGQKKTPLNQARPNTTTSAFSRLKTSPANPVP